MIHSLAGGNLGNESYFDFALVEVEIGGKYWYISKLGVKQGDLVMVPLKGEIVKGKVIRIDKNVSSYNSPIPIKMAKQIKGKI